MTKRALCVGIDTYPDDVRQLKGCKNDALAWKELLETTFNFKVTSLINSKATKNQIIKEFKTLLKESKDGDVAVFTLSSHGTWVTDESQDDDNEPDSRDEAFMATDGEIIVDDELRSIIEKMNKGVHLTVIIDSCFSGSGTRAEHTAEDKKAKDDRPRSRYTPPKNDSLANRAIFMKVDQKFLSPEEGMNEILFTACASNQICYETIRNGDYMGAFSAEAISIMRDNPTQSYQQLYDRLMQRLPSAEYRQNPQLEGSTGNKKLQLFEGAAWSSTPQPPITEKIETDQPTKQQIQSTRVQTYDWSGTKILFRTLIPAKRAVIGRQDVIPTDVREWISHGANQEIKNTIEQIEFPLSREQTDFDKRAKAVWNYVAKNIEYKVDRASAIADFWQFPAETLALKSGDCEDCAFLLASLLIASGISPFCVRVVFGKLNFPNGNTVGHCWPVYKNESGDWVILESTVDAIPQPPWPVADELAKREGGPRYSPAICFNQFHAWTVEPDSNIDEVAAYVTAEIFLSQNERQERQRLIQSFQQNKNINLVYFLNAAD